MKARRFAVLWERWLANSTEETYDEWLEERRAQAIQRRNAAKCYPLMQQQTSLATMLPMPRGLQNVQQPFGWQGVFGGALGKILFPS